MQRYFALDQNLTLSKADIYHLKTVMRKQPLAKIEVVYQGVAYLCEIISLTKDDVKLEVKQKLKSTLELSIPVEIAISLMAESKFNLILQKATELGVSKIIPLVTERSLIKLEEPKREKRQERWQRICKEAAEQARRNIIPKVEPVLDLADLKIKDNVLKLLCSPQESETTLKEILSKKGNYDRILVVIGPEGGLTEKEEVKLVNQGFIKISLGERILRTETVPIFILSILNYMDMR